MGRQIGLVEEIPVPSHPVLAARQTRLLLSRPSPGPRILVNVTVEDHATLLRRLGSFFKSPGPSTEPAETLNIEASMWGATSGVGTASFVLDPQRDGRSIDEGTPMEPILDGIQRFVSDDLRQQLPALKLLRPPQVSAVTLGPEANLFAERLLGEVRFGAPQTHSDPALDEHAAKQLAVAIERIASELHRLRVPVCYLFSPTTWTEHRPRAEPIPDDEKWVKECWWLRIGFGVSNTDRSTLSEVQASAIEIADSLGLGMAVYEPDHWVMQEHEGRPAGASDLMSYHFVPLVKPEEEGQIPTKREGPVEGIVITSHARAGLLADILAETSNNPISLYGVSMGVIFGHTVAHFVVRQGESETLEAAVDRYNHRLVETEGASAKLIQFFRFKTDGPSIAGRLVNDSRKERFWVAWRSPERPGVLSDLLEAIHDEFSRELGTADYEDENIVYAVSRIVSPGNTCAGKIAFVIDQQIASKLWGPAKIDDSPFAAQLRDRLLDVALDPADLDDWHVPEGCEDWRSEPVVVTHGEPAADPWGKLSLLAGSVPGYSEPA